MQRFQTATAALLSSTVLATAAHADLTAQEAWDSTIALMTMGPEIEYTVGSKEMEGDTLVVRDLIIKSDVTRTSDFLDSESSDRDYSTMTYEELRLTENDDGTVTLTYPAMVPIIIGGEGTYSDPFELRVEMRTEGYSNVISGDSDAQKHDFAADTMTIALTEIVKGDATLNGPTQAVMTDVAGTLDVANGDILKMDSSTRIGNVDIAVDLMMDDDGTIKAHGAVADIEIGAKIEMPDNIAVETEAYPEGLVVDVTYKAGTGTYDLDANTPDGPAKMQGRFESESGAFAMSEDALSLNGESKGLEFNLAAAAMPFPVSASLAEAGIGFAMPLGKSDDLQPAKLRVILDSLTINDEVWDLFDAARNLPRDPATLRVDVGMMVKMLLDITDPDSADVDIPGELHSAKINELKVDAAGLKVEGSGAVEFDNSDLESFDGIPAPVGSVKLDVAGANGLIDNLIKMGLIPDDQAMMGRMMLGMFARATGDDEMTSEIEFRTGGEVYANGQRLK